MARSFELLAELAEPVVFVEVVRSVEVEVEVGVELDSDRLRDCEVFFVVLLFSVPNYLSNHKYLFFVHFAQILYNYS